MGIALVQRLTQPGEHACAEADNIPTHPQSRPCACVNRARRRFHGIAGKRLRPRRGGNPNQSAFRAAGDQCTGGASYRRPRRTAYCSTGRCARQRR